MNQLFPKFIIESGCLVMMKVTYHSQIVKDKAKVKGGGWFYFDSSSKSYIFYGDSEDFGKATLEDIKECVWNDKVFRNPPKNRSLAGHYKFYYDSGVEIIELKKKPASAGLFNIPFLTWLFGKRIHKAGKDLKKAS